MKKIILSLFVLFVFSCSEKKVKEHAVALPGWIIGEWVSVQDSVVFIEKWEKMNDSLFNGNGFAIKGADTLFSEKLQMKKIGDTLFYIPTVAAQNQGQAVLFRFSRIDSSGFLAENKNHDFPKTIEYRLAGKDSLYAELNGEEKGVMRKEVFSMGRK